MVCRAVVAKCGSLLDIQRGKQELGSFSDLRYVCCGLLTLYVWRSEGRWCGVVWETWRVRSGEQGEKGRRIASREEPRRPA